MTVTIREELERRGKARVEAFSGGGTLGTIRGSKKAISIVLRTSTYPSMDTILSNSADRASQVSYHFPHHQHSFPLPTGAATSPAMIFQRNLTVILGS